ncbi:unnamed protein product [Paramecium primaurelia]|uniref:Uncharacterized protein n=1 Tax=Paramecium primaurelia TaxID=5886 RepID=A0A8S1K5Z5_PARPR|nr:unnamed protein product [Paramecium primaurelia]
MHNYSKIIKNLKSEEIDQEYERIRSQSKNRSYSTKNSNYESTKTSSFQENISLKNQLYILQEQLNNEKQRTNQLEIVIKKLKSSLLQQDKDLLSKCEEKIQIIIEKDQLIKQLQEQMKSLQTENDHLQTTLSEFQDLELTINQLTSSYNSIAPNMLDQQSILEQCLDYLNSLTKLINPILYGSQPQLQDLFKTKQKFKPRKKFQITELCENNMKHIQDIEKQLVHILDLIDQKFINELAQYIK